MRSGRLLRVGTVGAVVIVLAAGSCSSDNSSSAPERASQAAESTTPIPTAPESQRVDTRTPTFSHSTKIDNPLFPIASLHSAVLLGNVDGSPLRVETTLLPRTKTIDWKGQKIETLVSQFVAYQDGRIEEVAIDLYAQADDGAVWYFGEDVADYVDGVVASTDGTWRAGRRGPAAMIMPAHPRPGDVYRSENSPGIAFEQVTVKDVGVTVEGPSGPISGAMVGQELHMEGTYEDKVFAPGYGEFASGSGGEREDLAIAVPADVRPGPMPAELDTLSSGAAAVFEAAAAEHWDAASASLTEMASAWAAYRSHTQVPRLIDVEIGRALTALSGDALTPAVAARNAAGSRKAALGVALAVLDLQLRYRPPNEVDADRVRLWTRQLLLDAAKGDEPGQVAGDVRVLELVWDRIGPTFDPAAKAAISAQLTRLHAAAKAEDAAAATKGAIQLLDTLGPTP